MILFCIEGEIPSGDEFLEMRSFMGEQQRADVECLRELVLLLTVLLSIETDSLHEVFVQLESLKATDVLLHRARGTFKMTGATISISMFSSRYARI
jgi:hypothetical protein